MVCALFVRTNLEKNNILFSFYKNNKNNPSFKHYLFNSLADIFLMIRLRVGTCNLSTIILSETQIYNDVNKRTAVIFANHFLISKGKGLLIVDYNRVFEFKKYLVAYYEDRNLITIKGFLKGCLIKLK